MNYDTDDMHEITDANESGSKQDMSVEEILEKLQDLSGSLEDGDLTLEESFKAYESGMKLIQKATEIVDKVEKKIIVLQNESGEQEE